MKKTKGTILKIDESKEQTDKKVEKLADERSFSD